MNIKLDVRIGCGADVVTRVEMFSEYSPIPNKVILELQTAIARVIDNNKLDLMGFVGGRVEDSNVAQHMQAANRRGHV
jgi:hypothetical protein